MVAEDFDNPIVDGDETFQKHQRDLIHRTFDEWRSEYFKTLEDKKVDAKEEEQEKKEEEPKAIASSILDEPEELLQKMSVETRTFIYKINSFDLKYTYFKFLNLIKSKVIFTKNNKDIDY